MCRDFEVHIAFFISIRKMASHNCSATAQMAHHYVHLHLYIVKLMPNFAI